MIPSFPGGLCPRLEWQLMPEAIPSMIDVMREKSAYAAKVLDSGVVASEPTVAAARTDSHRQETGAAARTHK